MICPKCNQVVTEGKLVCECFTRQTEQEQENLILRRFAASENWLFLAKASKHFLPTRGYGLTLCGKQRFKRVDCQEIWINHFPAMEKDARYCQACVTKIRAFIDQSSAALSPEPSERS